MENNNSGAVFLPHYNHHKEENIIKIQSATTEKYIVRSLAMANWLCNNGHKMLKVEDSEKNTKFKVFLFEDTKELHNTMARFPKGV